MRKKLEPASVWGGENGFDYSGINREAECVETYERAAGITTARCIIHVVTERRFCPLSPAFL